jgi:AAA15 family ATPase/GTPase
MVSLLGDLDSGISNLQHVTIPIERIPDNIISEVEDDPEDQITGLDLAGDGLVFVLKQEGKVVARKLTTVHKSKRGENVDFGLDEESDGTRRLLDLLPAFLLLENIHLSKVFIIDEFDRSLHSLLARRLLDRYLSQLGVKSQSQLVFTTHNLQLMDQSLLRRDEIWVTERDKTGGSTLTALSEFKDIRNDKDIRKSYLQGRMGGVPRFRFRSNTSSNRPVGALL